MSPHHKNHGGAIGKTFRIGLDTVARHRTADSIGLPRAAPLTEARLKCMGDVDEWVNLDPSGAAALEAELLRELGPGHDLFGEPVSVVARRLSQDDVVVVTPSRAGVARVHLTWRGSAEPAPWPRTAWFDSVESAKVGEPE